MRLLPSAGNGTTAAFHSLSIALLTQIGMAMKTPEPPKLSFLYTAYAECDPNFMSQVAGPHGIRNSIPIVGGNFSGPHLSGKIMNVGADWGLVDPRTNIFSADTRYNLRTDDGADIYIQTSGPQVPDGHLHLRLVFETGSPKYYWLNNIVGMTTMRTISMDFTADILSSNRGFDNWSAINRKLESSTN
ncbi:UPF0311 protein [Penicillium subrubescens]|uniref:UPF0311 protein n=1 Tax=Penicillium subrubescens TaxID=1316194 RepID=A0A1Q5UEH4_9EURO|nr:UPF0311 protein [Penicillium subrubescens]